MTEDDLDMAAGDPVEVPIEDWIDLHSFRPADVAGVVEEYLREVTRRGFREVRIIHGRGIGVQRELVQSLLRRHPAVAAFSDAPDRGATLVTLAGRENSISGSQEIEKQRKDTTQWRGDSQR